MRVLAIGAHPDDIELGCGATIKRIVEDGGDAAILVCSTGAAKDMALREQEQRASCSVLSVRECNQFVGSFMDGCLEHSRPLITWIESKLEVFKPDLVLTHWKRDTHQDHVAVSEATLSACRRTVQLMYYEGPSSLEFDPTVFVDCVRHFPDKIEAIRAHKSQMDSFFVSGKSLIEYAFVVASFRGVQSKRHAQAEAFSPVRLHWPSSSAFDGGVM